MEERVERVEEGVGMLKRWDSRTAVRREREARVAERGSGGSARPSVVDASVVDASVADASVAVASVADGWGASHSSRSCSHALLHLPQSSSKHVSAGVEAMVEAMHSGNLFG